MKRSFSEKDTEETKEDEEKHLPSKSLHNEGSSILQSLIASTVEHGVPQLTLIRNMQDLKSDQVKVRIQALLWVSRNLQAMEIKEKTDMMEIMIDRLINETDHDIKCMVIILITRLFNLPTIKAGIILEELDNQLRHSKSTKVRHQLFRGVTKLLLVREVEWRRSAHLANLLIELSNFAVSELADTHHLIRATSIQLLSVLSSILYQISQYKRIHELASSSQSTTGDIQLTATQFLDRIEIQRIISNYVVDSDQRVRKSALEALVNMKLCGCPLDISLYKHGVRALKDDFEDVRMGGLNLIWALGCLYPEYRMRLAHEGIDEEVRLLDDAFVKICDMVNDVDVNVRTKACTIMASYQHVDPNVLSQTFSKQIMSHNTRKARGKKGAANKVVNRQSGKMIPVAEGDFDVESEEFRILDSGACGAFVHGLEDEYKEVRNASIDSICELCMYNDQFTTKAVDFLVDMFNDEIDQVRLNAIHSLRKIGTRTKLVLDADQLEIVIGALEDADKTARESTHDLLRVVRLSTQQSLSMLLDNLIANMERYSEDQLSIYRCLHDVGRSHADFIKQMVPDLLKYDKKYLPREANADDKNYIAYIIFIVNACYIDLSIVSLLPKYCFSHFLYLRSRFPECFPNLKEIFSKAPPDIIKQSQDIWGEDSEVKDWTTAEDVNQYMDGTLDMIASMTKQLGNFNVNGVQQSANIISRNLKYAAGLSPLVAGKANFADIYVSCCERFLKYKVENNLALESTSSLQCASDILHMSYRMEHTFLGLSGPSRNAGIYFRVLANMLWFFGIMKQISNDNPTNITNMLMSIIERIDVIQRIFDQDNFQLAELTDLRTNLFKARSHPFSTKLAALYAYVRSFTPLGLDLKHPLKRTTAKILVPAPNIDKPISFSANLPLKIHIEANFEFVDNINTIAVMVMLPDKSSRLFWPSHHCFKPTIPYCYFLATDIEINISLWTDIGMLQVSIVKSFEADLPGIDDFILKYPNYDTSQPDLGRLHNNSSTLQLCDAVEYYISPSKEL